MTATARRIGPKYLEDGERQLWLTDSGRWIVTVVHDGWRLADRAACYPADERGTITGPEYAGIAPGGHEEALTRAGWGIAPEPLAGPASDPLARLLAAAEDEARATGQHSIADRLFDLRYGLTRGD